jgi:hypothetical protein
MQIKILSEYAKDIKRSMNAVASAAGVHHEYVRRAVANLVTAVVEHNGDIESLQEIYSEGNYALRSKEIHRLLILVDNLVNNRNQLLEDSNVNRSQQSRSNEGSINRHYNKNTGNSRMPNNNNPFDYYGYGEQREQQQSPQQEDPINDLSTNALLLKEVLENQKNANPTNIHKFLRLFMLDEHTFVNEPQRLHALLIGMFNRVTAQAAFNLFMQMRSKYVQQVPGMGMGNAGGVSSYNLGDPQYLVQGGAEGYAARLAYEERREMLEDKRFDRYMRNMMMVNMQKMMGAQTPMSGDPGMMH